MPPYRVNQKGLGKYQVFGTVAEINTTTAKRCSNAIDSHNFGF